MAFVNKVAILDCIGFDLADRSRPLQVRFSKCLVDGQGNIERQRNDDKLLVHRVTIGPLDDIDAIMEVECAQIALMGYDPPTPQMIDRIKGHAELEWGQVGQREMLMLPSPEPMEFVPFDVMQKVKVN